VSVVESWIDVSISIESGMVVWPGDPPVRVERQKESETGEVALSNLTMSAHAGTHVDAPLHYLRGKESIERMPFEAMIGPARVIEIRDPVHITVDELSEYGIGSGERILFKTRNSARDRKDRFLEDFVHLTAMAAKFLANRKVLAVGIDYLSVGGYRRNEMVVHRTLLEAGVWIVENLDLAGVPAGEYDMVCLPLKVTGAEAAPARVLVRPRSPN
jgi:arylformamidase